MVVTVYHNDNVIGHEVNNNGAEVSEVSVPVMKQDMTPTSFVKTNTD
jgi:hypothetical protein